MEGKFGTTSFMDFENITKNSKGESKPLKEIHIQNQK